MAKIKKIRQKNFTVIDNTVANDTTLKIADKGLFLELWSLPEDWDFYVREIATHSADGIDGVRKAMEHLQGHGYLFKARVRNKLGQLKGSRWLLSETPKKEWIEAFKKEQAEKAKKAANKKKVPKLDFPIQANPIQEKPMQANPTLLNTNLTKYLPNQELTKQSTNNSLSSSLSNNSSIEDRDEEQIERDKKTSYIIQIFTQTLRQYDKPFTLVKKNEAKKLGAAIGDKDVKDIVPLVEQAVAYADTYPLGYLITLIKNLD